MTADIIVQPFTHDLWNGAKYDDVPTAPGLDRPTPKNSRSESVTQGA